MSAMILTSGNWLAHFFHLSIYLNDYKTKSEHENT